MSPARPLIVRNWLVRVFLTVEPFSQFYDPAGVFSEVLGDTADPGWRPYLLVGSRMSTNELLVAADLTSAQRRTVMRAIADVVREMASAHDVPVAAMYLPEPDARAFQSALGDDAVRLNSGTSGELPIRWTDLVGYLASLRPSRRQGRPEGDAQVRSGGSLRHHHDPGRRPTRGHPADHERGPQTRGVGQHRETDRGSRLPGADSVRPERRVPLPRAQRRTCRLQRSAGESAASTTA